jgi:hypothetical protein
VLHGQWRIGKERRRHPLRERAGLCISSASPTATVAPPTAAGGLDGGGGGVSVTAAGGGWPAGEGLPSPKRPSATLPPPCSPLASMPMTPPCAPDPQCACDTPL